MSGTGSRARLATAGTTSSLASRRACATRRPDHGARDARTIEPIPALGPTNTVRLLASLLQSVGRKGVAVVVRCHRLRSVFLSVPIAEASRELRGTRDTSPASCRCCIAGRRGTRYGRRGRFRWEAGSSGRAPDVIARGSGQAPCRSRASARGGRIPLVAGWLAPAGRGCRPRGRPRHLGPSLAPARVNPLMAGAFRASSLPAGAAQ